MEYMTPQTPMNIEQLQTMAMAIVENLCSIVAMPVEIILRPRYGTRYFTPPVIFFSAMLMILLPAFSSVADGVTHMIPFIGAAPVMGLFGIGSLAKFYFLLAFIHGLRQWRRMIYIQLEQHSEFEGPPLPFLYLIPGSRSFWTMRIVIEPLFVFIGASILEGFHIFQPGLVIYLHLAALALAAKSGLRWYRAWEYLRKILDTTFAGPIIAKLVANKATDDELATIHIASFPKNLAPDLRSAAAKHIARAFSSEDSIPKEQSHE